MDRTTRIVLIVLSAALAAVLLVRLQTCNATSCPSHGPSPSMPRLR